jgi:hypothetical protein
MPDALHFTGDPDADALIAQDPLALLIGFALDQQGKIRGGSRRYSASGRRSTGSRAPWRDGCRSSAPT